MHEVQTVGRDVLRSAIESGIACAARSNLVMSREEAARLTRVADEAQTVAVGICIAHPSMTRCPLAQAFPGGWWSPKLEWGQAFADAFDNAMRAAGVAGWTVEVRP